MQLSQVEYLERLVNLLPPSDFRAEPTLSFGKESIFSATLMVEDIALQVIKLLNQFADTDQVSDLKDAMVNQVVLSRFLAGSYYQIIEGSNH